MKTTLFIISTAPGSQTFEEAITALVGCSLFGQPIQFILQGQAADLTSNSPGPLEQLHAVMEMVPIEGFVVNPPATPAISGVRVISGLQSRDIIAAADHVLSF